MKRIISLKELKQEYRMINVQLRLPRSLREKVKQIAALQTKRGERVTESDIYRTAIISYVSQYEQSNEEIPFHIATP